MKRIINKILFLFFTIYLFSFTSLYSDNIENLIISCDEGNASNCRKLAILYIKQDNLLDDLKNIEVIQNLYHKACDAGDEESCLHLRILYFDNIKVADSKKVLLKFRKLPKPSQLSYMLNNIGYQYGNGGLIVSAVDYVKAFKLFKFVCENDIGASDYASGVGCYNLGTMYDNGQAIRRNHHKALELYAKGCKLGYEQSCAWVPSKL